MLELHIKENMVGFNGSYYDYKDIYGANSYDIKSAFEYMINKYSSIDLKDLFIYIFNKLKLNANYPILMGCYYMYALEKKGISTKNIINELKKHKNDENYIKSYVSVLKIAYYLTNLRKRIAFPMKSKKLTSDIIVKKVFNRKIRLEIKRRGLLQLRTYFTNIIDKVKKGQVIEPIFIEESIENELVKSKLRDVIKKAFKQADIVLIDESFNILGVGGEFVANDIKYKPLIKTKFRLKKGRIVFFSINKGKLSFIEYKIKNKQFK